MSELPIQVTETRSTLQVVTGTFNARSDFELVFQVGLGRGWIWVFSDGRSISGEREYLWVLPSV